MTRLAESTPRRGDRVLVTLWDGRVLSTTVVRVTLIPQYAASNAPQRIALAPARWYALADLPGLVREGSMGIRSIRRVEIGGAR